MIKPSIVFFGAGPVAAKSLMLLASNFSIEAVITKGHPNIDPIKYPVITEAKSIETKILYANTKNDVDVHLEDEIFTSKLGVLIDYGVIVSEKSVNAFPMGIVNSHFSLLPEWRGADPITYSLLSGQKTTGVTLMMLTRGMDEGPVLSQEKLDIAFGETGQTLTERLINLSDKMLKKTLPIYLSGDIQPIDQIRFAEANNLDKMPTYSKKIDKKDGQMNWSKTASELEREVRAYQPWRRSYTLIGENLSINIISATVDNSIKLSPGQLYEDKKRLIIGTKKGSLEILEVQPAGKNKMLAADFLRGYSNKLYSRLN